jgi:hypothetical protein
MSLTRRRGRPSLIGSSSVARRLHQAGGAVEGLPVDGHQLDVALHRLDQVAIRVRPAVGRDQHVAVEALSQAAEPL